MPTVASLWNHTCMGVRSLRDRGGRNFIQGDLTSRGLRDSADTTSGGGGGGGGVLSALGRFNERGGGGGGGVVLSASGRFNERGGGGGGGCCPRKVNSSGVINKYS